MTKYEAMTKYASRNDKGQSSMTMTKLSLDDKVRELPNVFDKHKMEMTNYCCS